eukprot:g76890.t1
MRSIQHENGQSERLINSRAEKHGQSNSRTQPECTERHGSIRLGGASKPTPRWICGLHAGSVGGSGKRGGSMLRQPSRSLCCFPSVLLSPTYCARVYPPASSPALQPTRPLSSARVTAIPMDLRATRECWLYQYEDRLVPYSEAWRWQQEMVKARVRRHPAPELADAVLLLQHPPVYTLGRKGDVKYLRFDPASHPEHELYRTERGGEVTFHCPGQLVCYPILNLNHYKRDLHWYLRQVEEVILRVLSVYGVAGRRDSLYTGVWVDNHKVAAIGFENIVPCGIEEESRKVGSMAQLVQQQVTMEEVTRHVLDAFQDIFKVRCITPPASHHTPLDMDKKLDGCEYSVALMDMQRIVDASNRSFPHKLVLHSEHNRTFFTYSAFVFTDQCDFARFMKVEPSFCTLYESRARCIVRQSRVERISPSLSMYICALKSILTCFLLSPSPHFGITLVLCW